MSKQPDSELWVAITFICRNSCASAARRDIMKQVIRCHVSKDYKDVLHTSTIKTRIEVRCNAIVVQFTEMGYF